MIRPWSPSNLAMVIAGLEEEGFERAVRLFPQRTGMVVPDWVVTGPEMEFLQQGIRLPPLLTKPCPLSILTHSLLHSSIYKSNSSNSSLNPTSRQPIHIIMKAFNTLLVTGLACLQFLATSHAQTHTTTTASSASATATASSSSSAAAQPTQPTFVNTPGLQVSSPYNGMSVIQNTVLSISASLADQRPIGSIVITVAKTDGSSNNTIVSVSNGNFIRANQIWNVTDSQYPIGEYYINLVITPNTTALPTSVPTGSTSTTTATQPVVTPNAGAGSSNIYYWRALVRVVAPRPSYPTSAAAPALSKINGYASVIAAAGVVILGSVFAL